LAIIAGGFTIVGVLIGTWAAYRLSIKLVERTHENDLELFHRQEFNKAAAAFKATFVDEIFRMRRGVDILHKRYGEDPDAIAVANEKAKIIFEAFLPKDMLSGFNIAWEKYKDPDEKNKITYSPLSPEYSRELGKIYLSHIDQLLEYATPK
jgi:hypothetical protein